MRVQGFEHLFREANQRLRLQLLVLQRTGRGRVEEQRPGRLLAGSTVALNAVALAQRENAKRR
jgi:hypothetical protein